MKKFLLFMALCLGVLSSHAQTRVDTAGNTVYHHLFAVAQYQIVDFDFAKESGHYGLGLVCSSISHWGAFHVGANANFSINAGLIENWGCMIEFGPSARIDISKSCFVNIPINVVCKCTSLEGTTDTETIWAGKIAPSIHLFATDRFGLYAGPQLFFGEGDPCFGMAAGLSYAF